VALDTPSRSTGIYISGGVMAAPTVGAVMSDILPYLGVEQHFSPDEIQGQTIVLDDLQGLTRQETEQYLKSQNLTALFTGVGETVTGQIPAAGQPVPGGSQVLIYLGTEPEQREVTVPDFAGMNRQQASDAAGKLGLYILVSGNTDTSTQVVATKQDIPAGQNVPLGTTIQLEFTDTGARD